MQSFKLNKSSYSVSFLTGICFLYLLSTGCLIDDKHRKPESDKANQLSELSVISIGSVRFRVSYIGHTGWNDQETRLLEIRDPNLDEVIDSTLLLNLNRVGIMHKDSLALKSFTNVDSMILKSTNGEALMVKGSYEQNPLRYVITVIGKKDSTEISLNSDIKDVKFALVDVVPGDFKEIIVLRNYYIMNGENYYINIYQINSN